MIARSNAPRSQRTRARSGFSLIESMVVVTIIGLMAASVMPAMMDMMANTRQHSSATDIMLLARAARREALLGHYAHALFFRDSADNNNGGIQVITGVTGHCNRAANNIGVVGPNDIVPPPNGWLPTMGGVRMSDYGFSGHRMYARMEMPQATPRQELRICYAANGETWVVGPGVPNAEQTMPAILYVNRDVAGRDKGVAREVVFMPGGTARLR